MKKIIDNLYLGDRHSAPADSGLIISCAEEIFEEQNTKEKMKYIKDDKHIYYNFEDYPDLLKMDTKIINDAILQIENNIKDKKIYVHCLWGVNRSASIVFMYMVRNKKLKSDNYNEAKKEFNQIYPDFSPNPGWREFLINNFGYKF